MSPIIRFSRLAGWVGILGYLGQSQAHMGPYQPGPIGTAPIWARAYMGPDLFGPGPYGAQPHNITSAVAVDRELLYI